MYQGRCEQLPHRGEPAGAPGGAKRGEEEGQSQQDWPHHQVNICSSSQAWSELVQFLLNIVATKICIIYKVYREFCHC